MNELINQRVSVMTTFDRMTGKTTPVRIKWQGRIYKTKKIGLTYPTRAGKTLVHYFTVETDEGTSFKIRLDTDNLIWTLEEIIDASD
jgi:hypothetical protein